MPTTLSDPWLLALAPRHAVLEPRARAAVAGLSAAQLAKRPPEGGWSIAETFEHLVMVNTTYFLPMDRTIAREHETGRPPRAKATTFFGRLLVTSMAESNRRRVPTSRRMVPRTVRIDVVQECLVTFTRLGGLMQEADGADLRAMLTSPLLPLVRLNLGEAFELMIAHSERHLGQIERTRRNIGA